MGFPSQVYWSGLLFASPGDLPNSGIKLTSPELQADSLLLEPLGNRHKDSPQSIPSQEDADDPTCSSAQELLSVLPLLLWLQLHAMEQVQQG